MQGPPQIPGFTSLDERASEVNLDGLVVKVCSLDDLLTMKRASHRPRDLEDIQALEAARDGEES